MGRATEVVEAASARPPRPQPSAEVLREGARRAEPDGTVTVIEEGWDKPTAEALVVDRSPTRVTD